MENDFSWLDNKDNNKTTFRSWVVVVLVGLGIAVGLYALLINSL